MSDDLTAWLRRRIEERLYLAKHAIELGNAAVWTELSSGVLMTVDPDAPQEDGGHWGGVHPFGDSSLSRLMEANDPRDTIARCEAELGLLRQHKHLPTRTGAYGTPFTFGCETCHEMADPDGNSDVMADGWCETVCLLGYAYRFRDGWKEEWAPYQDPVTGKTRDEILADVEEKP